MNTLPLQFTGQFDVSLNDGKTISEVYRTATAEFAKAVHGVLPDVRLPEPTDRRETAWQIHVDYVGVTVTHTQMDEIFATLKNNKDLLILRREKGAIFHGSFFDEIARASASPLRNLGAKEASTEQKERAAAIMNVQDKADIHSVTPLFRGPEKLRPNLARIFVKNQQCPSKCNGNSPVNLLADVACGTLTVSVWCVRCRKQTKTKLNKSDEATFEFFKEYWGESKWVKAINASYIQMINGKMMHLLTNEYGELEPTHIDPRAFNAYVAGKKYVKWVVPEGKVSYGKRQKPEAPHLCFKDVVPMWLHSDFRAKCEKIIFDPHKTTGLTLEGFYNMYTGFGVSPSPPASGDWDDAAPMFRQHIEEVICGGDQVSNEYLLNCLAFMIQTPWKKLEVVPVFRSGKGAGKSMFIDAIRKILGRHSIEVTHARHATGNFNQHLQYRSLVVFNEATWGGDKASEGTLKAAVTEKFTLFESKGVNAVERRNYWTIFICSNESWCIPATPDSRRFHMFQVSDHRIGDTSYFAALAKALEQGETSEFLWYLQNRRLPEDWVPYNNMPPRSPEFVQQILQDRANAPLKLLVDKLKEHGEWIFKDNMGRKHSIFRSGQPTKVRKDIFMEAIAPATRNSKKLQSVADMSAFLKKALGKICFDNRARLPAALQYDHDESSAKCYRFASAEDIKHQLASCFLKVPDYFAQDEVLTPEQCMLREMRESRDCLTYMLHQYQEYKNEGQGPMEIDGEN